jgi:hypothetical protein
MTESNPEEECVSTRPWSEVLNRSLKLFTFNVAREGGRSLGRVLFYVILAVLAIGLVTFVVDSLTGWFSNWFDFWPFSGGAAEVEAEKTGWFGRDAAEGAESAPAPETGEKWYCRFNPLC